MSKQALDEFDRGRDEMMARAMAKLPPEDKIAATVEEMCQDGAASIGGGWTCSKQKGHAPTEGHAAHGMFGIVARW